jgi:hypothetical protein
MLTHDQLEPYIQNGLISEVAHPEDANVRIYNYTQKCQFEQAWDDVTRQCRGLILNVSTGQILARPFPKFFNYQEYVAKGWPVPTGKMEVFEKLDGSLGILYALNGKSWIATRGSFTSDQALWATKWFHEAVETDRAGVVDQTKTALFEIIYAANRIVVNYNFSGLVHLGTIDIATGKTVPDMWPQPFRIPAPYDLDNLEKIATLDEPNIEGFVIHFPDHDFRMKIKFPEYVRLHKLVTGVSEIAIWEHLRDGKGLDDLLEKVPDEFYQWVKSVQDRLTREFFCIEEEAGIAADLAKNKPTRKEQALLITKTRYPGIAFSMLDGKDYKQGIWRLIRPRGQSAFKTDIDL